MNGFGDGNSFTILCASGRRKTHSHFAPTMTRKLKRFPLPATYMCFQLFTFFLLCFERRKEQSIHFNKPLSNILQMCFIFQFGCTIGVSLNDTDENIESFVFVGNFSSVENLFQMFEIEYEISGMSVFL